MISGVDATDPDDSMRTAAETGAAVALVSPNPPALRPWPAPAVFNMANPQAITHLLFIEDEPAFAQAVERYLSEAEGDHFVVRHVPNLTEALRWLDNRRFDLVLLNLTLPDSEGLDTLRLLRTK
jgi:hypothetical protein